MIDQTDVEQVATAETDADPADGAMDEPVLSLAQRIQSYAGRFPQDDLDRKAGASSDPPGDHAGAMPAESPAAPPAPPDPETATPAQPEPAADGPPTLTIPPPAPPAAAESEPPSLPAAEAVVHTTVENSPSPAGTAANAPVPGERLPHIEWLDVRPVPAGDASDPGGPLPAGGPNQPVLGPGHTRSAPALAALIEQLETAVSGHPRQLEDQFRLRLLYMAAGQDDKAIGPIAGTDAIQSELLCALFKALAATRDALRNPGLSPGSSLAEADELRRLIAQQSPVQILKMALVTRVNSFGDYQAISPHRFPAGQPIHVFLYTEIGNFRSEPTADNRLRTLLAETVEVFDSAGRLVWERSEPHIEDLVLSPRRDFFMATDVQLPAALPAGEYVLKVTVEDKLGATMDQRRMTLTLETE